MRHTMRAVDQAIGVLTEAQEQLSEVFEDAGVGARELAEPAIVGAFDCLEQRIDQLRKTRVRLVSAEKCES